MKNKMIRTLVKSFIALCVSLFVFWVNKNTMRETFNDIYGDLE